MRTRWLTVLCAIAIAAALPSCSREALPGGVVLIVMDTVRADHLSCYGYQRRTSPWIDAFAAHSTQYMRAIAAGTWTVPSHASMFTGKHPFEHGARRTDKIVNARYDNAAPLDESHFTLAEAFEQEGYETAAFVANDGYLTPRWQLDQGFQTYVVDRKHATVFNERVFAWLDSLDTDRFFLFINYMDAHNPYNTTPVEGLLDEPVSQQEVLRNYLVNLIRRPEGSKATPDLVKQVIDQYDTGIANLDEGVGALIDRLRAWGRYETSTIIVTADHGEAFGEHDVVGHGFDVYDPEVWVPLVVKAPGQREGQVVEEPISLSDLPRLIFSLMARDLGKKYASEFPNAPGNHPVIAETFYASQGILQLPGYGERFRRSRTAVIDGSLKLIDSSDGVRELYDLGADAAELHDLIDARGGDGERLAEEVERFRATRQAAPEGATPMPLTEEELKRLKALGYVGN